MNYGFVIDTRSCIGCHACSTACKSENDVPLGVNRTWVKYTEQGQFPDVRRSFQVTRCNHCANPPCVRICPVSAMYQRKDGIVEFNGDSCIGCKGCLQACPYDAIYIDPDSCTAAKCHFCGHRVEQGLEPACVVVCPTHSIIAGDIDDPKSEIARVLAKNNTTVRKPEQGTAPKLFYVDGNALSLHPTALPREPLGTMMVDVLDAHGHNPSPGYAEAAKYEVKLRFGEEEYAPANVGSPTREPAEQGVPSGGPITVAAGRFAGQMTAQVAHTAWHKIPWHWQVPAYLVTKSLGTGVFLALAALTLFDLGNPPKARVALGVLGIVATLVTTGLLVGDLERPERFLRILTRPQWKSWLVRGAFLLIGFSIVATAILGVDAGRLLGFAAPAALDTALAVLVTPLAIGAATYTAWLFAQCEGRDLWQSPVLAPQLFVHAILGGAAGLLIVAPFFPSTSLLGLGAWTLVAALAVNAGLLLFGEFGVAHPTELAARAAKAITHGKYRRQFWGGAVLIGHLVPLLLLMVPAPFAAWLGALAGVLALVGMFAHEHAFVMAPQELPNS